MSYRRQRRRVGGGGAHVSVLRAKKSTEKRAQPGSGISKAQKWPSSFHLGIARVAADMKCTIG